MTLPTTPVLGNSNTRQTFSGVAAQSPMSPPLDVKPVTVTQSLTSYSAAASSSQAMTAMQQRVRDKPNVSSTSVNTTEHERTSSSSPVSNSVMSESLASRLSPEVSAAVSTDSTVSSATLSQDSTTVDLISQPSYVPVAITTSVLSTASNQSLATAVSQFDVSTRLENFMRTTAQTSRSQSPLLSNYSNVSSGVVLPVTSANEQLMSGVLEERGVQGAYQAVVRQVSNVYMSSVSV